MLESPANSSSSANDFNRYSYCPIPLVYHALFRARKTPTTRISSSKSLSTRSPARSFDPVAAKRSSKQIFVPPTLTHRRPSNFRSTKFNRCRLETPKKADDFVESAHRTPPHAPRTHERGLHEVVRTRSRPQPHQSPKHSLGAGPRIACRPTSQLTVLLRASSQSYGLASVARTVSVALASVAPLGISRTASVALHQSQLAQSQLVSTSQSALSRARSSRHVAVGRTSCQCCTRSHPSHVVRRTRPPSQFARSSCRHQSQLGRRRARRSQSPPVAVVLVAVVPVAVTPVAVNRTPSQSCSSQSRPSPRRRSRARRSHARRSNRTPSQSCRRSHGVASPASQSCPSQSCSLAVVPVRSRAHRSSRARRSRAVAVTASHRSPSQSWRRSQSCSPQSCSPQSSSSPQSCSHRVTPVAVAPGSQSRPSQSRPSQSCSPQSHPSQSPPVATPNAESARPVEQRFPLPSAHRAGRRPALGQPGARSAQREDARRASTCHARGSRSQILDVDP